MKHAYIIQCIHNNLSVLACKHYIYKEGNGNNANKQIDFTYALWSF